MRPGSPVPPRRRRTATPNTPAKGQNRPVAHEFEAGRDKVAKDAYLTAAEVLALGEALADLLSTPGWKLYETLLDRMQRHFAVQGIRDAEQSKDYVRGKLDCIDDLRAAVASYISDAQKVAGASEAHKTSDPRVVSALFPGARGRRMI